jgi:hypothetical protein
MPIPIKLDYLDNILSGKYLSSDGDLIIDLDSTACAFSVTMPEIKSCGTRFFIFKNNGTNDVTLGTLHGQLFDNPASAIFIVKPNHFVFVSSDTISKFLTLD